MKESRCWKRPMPGWVLDSLPTMYWIFTPLQNCEGSQSSGTNSGEPEAEPEAEPEDKAIWCRGGQSPSAALETGLQELWPPHSIPHSKDLINILSWWARADKRVSLACLRRDARLQMGAESAGRDLGGHRALLMWYKVKYTVFAGVLAYRIH